MKLLQSSGGIDKLFSIKIERRHLKNKDRFQRTGLAVQLKLDKLITKY